MLRKLVTISILWSIVSSSLLIGTAHAQADNSPFPAPGGPFKIGTVTYEWTDESRDELFTSSPDDKRKLLVQLWYPADSKSSGELAPYMLASDKTLSIFEALIAGSRNVDLQLPRDKFAVYKTHAYESADLASDQTNYPVLIFSPGFGATPSMYTVQIEELASRGYIIAAINHPYGSSTTAFLDGSVVTINPDFNSSANLPVWIQDQVFVLNQLETLNAKDSDKRFTGKLDMKHVGIFGHSLGAATALMVAKSDSRVTAVLSEDSPALGKRMDKSLSQPALLMENEDNVDANVAVYQQATGHAYDLTMNTFEHDNFGDFGFWPGIEPLKSASALGSISATRANTIVNEYLVAFFDKHLKGKTVTLLDKASSEYKEVLFQSK